MREEEEEVEEVWNFWLILDVDAVQITVQSIQKTWHIIIIIIVCKPKKTFIDVNEWHSGMRWGNMKTTLSQTQGVTLQHNIKSGQHLQDDMLI